MIKGFGQITRKYLGQDFSECNCLGLLYNILTDAGIDVPDHYKGYNLDTYMSYWKKTPKEAIKDMIIFFKTIGKEVDPRYLKRGDIVVIKHKDSKFPAIYVGDKNVMVATREKGVMTFSLGQRFQPIMARRII